MKKAFYLLVVCSIVMCFVSSVNGQTVNEKQTAIEKTQNFINEIARKSYPEIKLKKVKIN